MVGGRSDHKPSLPLPTMMIGFTKKDACARVAGGVVTLYNSGCTFLRLLRKVELGYSSCNVERNERNVREVAETPCYAVQFFGNRVQSNGVVLQVIIGPGFVLEIGRFRIYTSCRPICLDKACVISCRTSNCWSLRHIWLSSLPPPPPPPPPSPRERGTGSASVRDWLKLHEPTRCGNSLYLHYKYQKRSGECFDYGFRSELYFSRRSPFVVNTLDVSLGKVPLSMKWKVAVARYLRTNSVQIVNE